MFLIEVYSELITIFFGEVENPVGVHRLDYATYEWREVKHLGNRTLFVGMEGLFHCSCRRTQDGNKIYSAKFMKEYDCEFLSHSIGVEASFEGKFTRTDFIHAWVEPK